MTASEMFGMPVKDMPGEVRRRAKAINFGIIYGISAFGLANQLGIAREEAGAYIKKYFERFPGIRDYMEETKRSVKRTATCSLCSGASATTRTSSIPTPRSAPSRARRHQCPPARQPPPTSSAAPWCAWRRRSPRKSSPPRCCCRCTTSWCSSCRRGSRQDLAGGEEGDGTGPAAGARPIGAAFGRRAGGEQLGRGALSRRPTYGHNLIAPLWRSRA